MGFHLPVPFLFRQLEQLTDDLSMWQLDCWNSLKLNQIKLILCYLRHDTISHLSLANCRRSSNRKGLSYGLHWIISKQHLLANHFCHLVETPTIDRLFVSITIMKRINHTWNFQKLSLFTFESQCLQGVVINAW